MTPSINRMIKLLTDEECQYVTKDKVIKCEEDVLLTFDFDFNVLSPMTFIERFLRQSDLHTEFQVDILKFEVLKLLLNNIKFNQFKKSHQAAAGLAICLNLIRLSKA